MGRLVSPDALLNAAKAEMLGGREPVTEHDYARILNFCAANVMPQVAESVCMLMRTIYEMPITEDYVREIVRFQLRNQS